MTSKVEICNKALSLLSANLIMAFDPDESVEAALCVTNYESARRYALEKRGWTFATKRIVMTSPSATAPEWGYDFKHLLPSDLLRVLIVSEDPAYKDGGSLMDWRKESDDGGDYIVCNFSTIYVKYIYDQIQEVRFSPTFVEAMSHQLAYLMATPLTESKGLKNDLLAEFERLTSEASGTDGTQGASDRIRSNRLLNVRRQRGRNFGRRP